VVGPRAAWVHEETHLEQTTDSWRKRWFVKPGLTGLAQINDASSTSPEEKLRHDVTYIRKQSFWFDLKIIARQLWMVFVDTVQFVR
jgi:lipopolysaccharide/colanic/teichoic acid biosynthesis glycosyltransferase